MGIKGVEIMRISLYNIMLGSLLVNYRELNGIKCIDYTNPGAPCHCCDFTCSDGWINTENEIKQCKNALRRHAK